MQNVTAIILFSLSEAGANTIYRKVFVAFCISFLWVCFAHAQDSIVQNNNTQNMNMPGGNASIQMYYTSNYIFRDFVAGFQAVQPSATYNVKNTGLSFQLWTSVELKYQTQNIEISPSISYGYTFKNGVQLAAGVIYYIVALPGEIEGQNLIEFFGSFSPTSFPLSPIVTLYYSDTGYGYGTLAISQPLTKNQNGIYAYGWLGYRIGLEGEKNGIKELVLGISTPIKIKKFSFWIDGILTHLPHATGRDTYVSGAVTVNLN